MDDKKGIHKQEAENAVYEALSNLSDSTKTLEESSILMLDSTDDMRCRDKCQLPPLRARSIVAIMNTPRWFKTPSRESTAQKEEKFISRHPSLFMKDEFRSPCTDMDMDMTNENPLQLREKGDALYKNKDYLSAVNAYTLLLNYNDTKVHALIHRSHCYSQLGEVTNCIHDCEQLLNILDDSSLCHISPASKLTSSRNLQGSIYLLLGCAYSQYNPATTNFNLALEYFQKSKDVTDGSVSVMDACIQQVHRLQRANHAKNEGDAFIQQGCTELAMGKYVEALSIEGTLFTATTNMTVAMFTLGNYKDCVQSCSDVIQLLTTEKKLNEYDGLYVPPPASVMRRKIKSTLESRRERALKELGHDVAAP